MGGVIMMCEKCGEIIPDNAKVCPSCGMVVGSAAKAEEQESYDALRDAMNGVISPEEHDAAYREAVKPMTRFFWWDVCKYVVLVVFFEDTELEAYSKQSSRDIQDYYCHAVAKNVVHEKENVVATLRQCGIYALLTKPQNLTVDVINRYLEMKAAHSF